MLELQARAASELNAARVPAPESASLDPEQLSVVLFCTLWCVQGLQRQTVCNSVLDSSASKTWEPLQAVRCFFAHEVIMGRLQMQERYASAAAGPVRHLGAALATQLCPTLKQL